jgi:hypothetical protein
MSRNRRLRRFLLAGVSHISLNRACAARARAELNRGAGRAPAATVEAAAGRGVTAHSRNSRKRKAPTRTGASRKVSHYVPDIRTRLRAQ